MNLKSLIFGAVAAAAVPFAASAVTVTVFVDPDGPGGNPPLSSGPIPVNGTVANGSLFSGSATGGVVDITPVVNALNGGSGGRIGDVDFEVQIAHDGDAPGFVELQFIAGLDPDTSNPFGNLSVTTIDLRDNEFVGLNVTSNSVQNQTDPISAVNGPNGDNDQLTFNFFDPNPGNVSDPKVADGQKTIDTDSGYVVENQALSFYVYWEQAQGGDDGAFSIFFDGAEGGEVVVPLPAGVILLLSALGGFGFLRYRRTA